MKFLAAKLFWAVAIVSVLTGVALFHRGLSAIDYLNPLFLLFIPRLVPFSVAVLSFVFGLVYFAVERNLKWPLNFPLTISHLVLFLVGVFSYVGTIRTWNWVLNEGNRVPPPSLQIESILQMAMGLSLGVFVWNIVWSYRKRAQKI